MNKNIRERLQLSVVKFAYKKKNGETRYATGTTNVQILNDIFNLGIDDKQEKEQIRNGTTPYFDLAKKSWRSFRDENFIDVIND